MRPINTVVLDCDGVLTDGFVYVDESGRESARFSRKDGHGIAKLKAAGIRVIVISKERNPIVARRCEKLNVECRFGIDDKAAALRDLVSDLNSTLYMGDDEPDIPAMEIVGCAVAPRDACVWCRAIAHHVTAADGGRHAVREMAEWLLRGRQ